MSGWPASATYRAGIAFALNCTGVRMPTRIAVVESVPLYIANVGFGRTLSQSPPMTVHDQLVACGRTAGSVIHKDPSMMAMFFGSG